MMQFAISAIRSRLTRMTVVYCMMMTAMPLVFSVTATAQTPSNAVSFADTEFARRNLLLPQYAPRYRRLRETLLSLKDLQSTGRSAEALKSVQWILDQPYDMLYFGDSQTPASVKQLAENQLRGFPDDWLKQYERIFGVEARHLFSEAQANQDEGVAIQILRRFNLTSTAADARVWLANRLLDRGEAAAAYSVLMNLDQQEKKFRNRNRAELVLLHRVALHTGDVKTVTAVEQEIRERKLPVPKQRVLNFGVENSPPAEHFVAGTGKSPTVSVEYAPVIRPTWTANLIQSASSPHFLAVLDGWRSQQQEQNLASVVAKVPLVVRDQVIVRTYDGLTAFRRENGQAIWSFPCESSLSVWINDVIRQRRLDPESGQMLPGELLQWWFASNTQLNDLSSDGVRVYLVDSFRNPAARMGRRGDPFQNRGAEGPRPHEANRLVAMLLPDSNESKTPRMAWSLGRSLRDGEALAEDRYFLGPPLPHAGRLYQMAEVDREIRVLALEPETGDVIWEQPLATVDLSAVSDGERAFLASQPMISEDLLICPTLAGILAAVNATTGQLAWIYYDGDLPAEPVTNRPRQAVIARGRPGFASRTVEQDGRIVHLPVNSSHVHCLSRNSGVAIWSVPRQRACSIAEVTDELVILLEDRGCRALRLSDGQEAWRQSLPAITGTGITCGTEYLAPLEQGRFARINLTTGAWQGWQPPQTSVSLGNLTPTGDMILSTGAEGVTAFPSLRRVRQTLQDKNLVAAERTAWQVDLALTEGNLDLAERNLELVLSQDSLEQTAALKGHLRELLYYRLERSGQNQAPDFLHRIEQLVSTPAEQARLLAHEAQWAAGAEKLHHLRAVLNRFSELPVDAVFQSPKHAGLTQSASAFCSQLLAETEIEQPEFVQIFRRELIEKFSRQELDLSQEFLSRFVLRVCDRETAIDGVRNRLAQSLKIHGRRHSAELLWWRNRQSGSPQLKAAALYQLSELWSDAGWPRDAVAALNELHALAPQLNVDSHRTIMDVLSDPLSLSESKEWQRRLRSPPGALRQAVVSSAEELELPSTDQLQGRTPRGDGQRQNRFGESPRRLIPEQPLAAEVMVRMQGPHAALAVVDKSTSEVIREWPVPARHSHPWPGHEAIHAHFLPIGVTGELRGYSLLDLTDDRPLWVRKPLELQHRRSVPMIGPAAVSFVSFQSQNVLMVCDPWDGALIWQRDDLEPNSGLHDPGTGIIGDQECLTVFGSDRLSYKTYETMTGRLLHQGRLEIEPRPVRRAFGRKLFSVSQSRGRWLARIWDPLIDAWTLEEPLNERFYAPTVTGSAEVAWLTNEGQLKVMDVPSGKQSFEIAWGPDELAALNSLRLMTDGDRSYVNFQRNSNVVQTNEYHYPYSETIIPSLHIRDDLYAIDRRSGKVIWRRAVPARTLLKLEPENLPFLVLLSRIRDPHDNNLQTLLVEVLDATTGNLIARRNGLPADRFLQAEFDAVDRRLRLVGQKSSVEIRLVFAEPEQSIP